MKKKTLLVFFGEYRTFEYILPHLKNLNMVDIILSTWSISTHGLDTPHLDNFYLKNTNIENIKNKLPNLRVIVSDNEYFKNKSGSWRMVYSWKRALDSIQSDTKYDKVFVQRCDTITNWEIILDKKIENDILYIDNEYVQREVLDMVPFHLVNEDSPKDSLWVDDKYFYGSFSTIKKFVNLVIIPDDIGYGMIHDVLGKTLLKNFNFKFLKDIDIKYRIVRSYHRNFIKKLEEKSIIFSELINTDNSYSHEFDEINNPN